MDTVSQQVSQDAISEDRLLFRSVVESMTDMLIVVDAKGSILYVNASVVKSFGFISEELLGKNVLMFVHPLDVLSAQNALKTLFGNSGKRVELECRVRTKAGAWRYVHTSGTVIQDAGKISRIVVVANDITDQKKEQDAKLNAILHSVELVERLSIGIFRTTPGPAGTFIEVNQGLVTMFEAQSREELMGHAVQDLYADPEARANISDKVQREGFLKNEEIAYKTFKGRLIWGSVTLIREISEKGEVFFNGLIIDITARKEAENRVSKLTRAVAQSPESIVITDLKGNIEYVNPTFEKNTGYTFAEVVGKNPRILQSGTTSVDVYAKLWATILAGHTWEGELQNKKKNGELYWESAIISGVTDEHGRVTSFLAVKQDITEKKKTQEQLVARTRESERMNALMVGRELRMMELKQEIVQLKEQIETLRR